MNQKKTVVIYNTSGFPFSGTHTISRQTMSTGQDKSSQLTLHTYLGGSEYGVHPTIL